MASVVVMLPEPIHTVITAPEVIAALTLVVVGVLTWFTVRLKLSTDRMQETVNQTHEQVTNTHSTNLRDDMDGVSGGIESLSRLVQSVSDQQAQTAGRLAMLAASQQGGFKRIDHQFGEVHDRQQAEIEDRQAVAEQIRSVERNATEEHARIWRAMEKERAHADWTSDLDVHDYRAGRRPVRHSDPAGKLGCPHMESDEGGGSGS